MKIENTACYVLFLISVFLVKIRGLDGKMNLCVESRRHTEFEIKQMFQTDGLQKRETVLRPDDFFFSKTIKMGFSKISNFPQILI